MTETRHYCDLCKKAITATPIDEIVVRNSAQRETCETTLFFGEEPVETVRSGAKVYDLCPECAGRIKKYMNDIRQIYAETRYLSGGD